MGTDEFDDEAAATADAAADLAIDQRIAAACRGSGNPAALAWLAEALELAAGQVVVDLGAGLGGPAAWLERHYRCRVVASDPFEGATRGARDLFALATVRALATATPIRSGAATAAVVLGVLSVVDEPTAALREAARIAGRVGVLEWCSTEAAAVSVGGSRFPTPAQLQSAMRAAGWSVRQSVPCDLAVPLAWDDAADVSGDESTDDERAVEDAIGAGRLRVQLAVADR